MKNHINMYMGTVLMALFLFTPALALAHNDENRRGNNSFKSSTSHDDKAKVKLEKKEEKKGG